MPAELATAIKQHMRDMSLCQGDCTDFALCKLLPAGATPDSPSYQECLNTPLDQPVTHSLGYCYIDAMSDTDGDGTVSCGSACTNSTDAGCTDCVGNPQVVKDCPAAQKRLLRFVSPLSAPVPLPWPNSNVFVACQGNAP